MRVWPKTLRKVVPADDRQKTVRTVVTASEYEAVIRRILKRGVASTMTFCQLQQLAARELHVDIGMLRSLDSVLYTALQRAQLVKGGVGCTPGRETMRATRSFVLCKPSHPTIKLSRSAASDAELSRLSGALRDAPRNGPFLCGHDKPLYADAGLYQQLCNARLAEPSCLDVHPHVLRFMTAFEDLPTIKAYYSQGATHGSPQTILPSQLSGPL